MIPQNIFKILKDNSNLNNFLNDIEDFEIHFKKLNNNEINRLSLEYSAIFGPKFNISREDIPQKINLGDFQSILTLTLIKKDLTDNNYKKIKKIKFYLDDLNENIIKILEN